MNYRVAAKNDNTNNIANIWTVGIEKMSHIRQRQTSGKTTLVLCTIQKIYKPSNIAIKAFIYV